MPVRTIPVYLTYPLRHEILRPHQSIAECHYAADDADDSAHFGWFDSDELIGIISVYHAVCPRQPEADAWQLRALAVRQQYRGKGFAGKLLHAVIGYAQSNKGHLVWCNARLEAAALYRKYGFSAQGQAFVVSGIGLHCLMVKVLRHQDIAQECFDRRAR